MWTLSFESIAIEEYLPTSFDVAMEEITHAPLESVANLRSLLVWSK